MKPPKEIKICQIGMENEVFSLNNPESYGPGCKCFENGKCSWPAGRKPKCQVFTYVLKDEKL